MKRVAIAVALVVALAGAGTGIALAVRSSSGISPAEARTHVARFERDWRAELRTGAQTNPTRRFPSPSLDWLKQRVQYVQILCGCFTVVEIKLLHPLQTAPLVVVQTKDEQAFFERQDVIFRLLAQSLPARVKRGFGWAYEGFLLEARNGAGVPFLATDVVLRGRGYGGGGFWAIPRFDRHFAHG